jgi:hypothetical protein
MRGMAVFGIVIPVEDETPNGRACAALRRQLPNRFPEHHFEFINQSEVKGQGLDVSFFQALGAHVTDEEGDEVSEGPGPYLLEKVQAAVDEIVDTAKTRSVN